MHQLQVRPHQQSLPQFTHTQKDQRIPTATMNGESEGDFHDRSESYEDQ